MKKTKKALSIIFIFISYLLSITNISNADFWSLSSLDLYKNIDAWINWLVIQMTNYELEWWNEKKWILNWINKLAKKNWIEECLDESKKISVDKFNKIISNESWVNTSEIIKLFKPDCNNGNVSIKLINQYSDLFTLYSDIKTSTAKDKSEKIYKLSQIWIYSDWNEENSWFDLIKDIEEIDKIIFANVIDYEWEQIDSIDKTLNAFFEPLNKKVDELTTPKNFDTTDKADQTNNIDNTIYSPKNQETDKDKIINTTSNYICPPKNKNDNWLSYDALQWLLNNINTYINWWINNNIWNTDLDNNNQVNNWNNNSDSDKKNKNNWAYQKVTDNSIWPCDNFFCIMIDFVTYEHSLFWGWEDITIEYLLNRSNKHLSKFAATSLIPAKMWTNNFELWLKDLNLPDIFHLSFQVSTKPIPILNIEKQWKTDNSEFWVKNMLEQYYEAYWLDYKRRNNLDAFVKFEADKQWTNNSVWLAYKNFLNKQKENDNIANENKKRLLTLQKAIESKVSYWTIWTFEEQFTELDKFTVWIINYSNTLDWLIKQLNKVPIDKN